MDQRNNIIIALEEPRRGDVVALLEEHLADMHEHTPPESVHALDIDALCVPEISFWTAREDGQLMGCGALRRLDAQHGEIKSMRTAMAYRRRGVGALMLQTIMDEARRLGMVRLSLETGTPPAFDGARALYRRHGFVECPPFGNYRIDPYSVCMTREI